LIAATSKKFSFSDIILSDIIWMQIEGWMGKSSIWLSFQFHL